MSGISFIPALGILIGLHALADYPLQGDFLAKAKNHLNPIPGVPFYQALAAHGAIHGAAVGVFLQSPLLGACEFVAHCAIDYLKCANRISFNVDQALHVACKVIWLAIAIGVA